MHGQGREWEPARREENRGLAWCLFKAVVAKVGEPTYCMG